MTPVVIGDTQGTLQARKTFKTVYKHPESTYSLKPQQSVRHSLMITRQMPTVRVNLTLKYRTYLFKLSRKIASLIRFHGAI